MKKTGDVFWKVMFSYRGSKQWEFIDRVFTHPKRACDYAKESRAADFDRGKFKVVKAELFVK